MSILVPKIEYLHGAASFCYHISWLVPVTSFSCFLNSMLTAKTISVM